MELSIEPWQPRSPPTSNHEVRDRRRGPSSKTDRRMWYPSLSCSDKDALWTGSRGAHWFDPKRAGVRGMHQDAVPSTSDITDPHNEAKRRLSCVGSNGRYWARTSDPQLVDPFSKFAICARSRGFCRRLSNSPLMAHRSCFATVWRSEVSEFFPPGDPTTPVGVCSSGEGRAKGSGGSDSPLLVLVRRKVREKSGRRILARRSSIRDAGRVTSRACEPRRRIDQRRTHAHALSQKARANGILTRAAELRAENHRFRPSHLLTKPDRLGHDGATWDNRPRPVTDTLDATLKVRLRAVLDNRPVTETELRNLIEGGLSCVLILERRLRGIEQRITDLSADPTSSLADIATEIRAANEVQTRPRRAPRAVGRAVRARTRVPGILGSPLAPDRKTRPHPTVRSHSRARPTGVAE